MTLTIYGADLDAPIQADFQWLHDPWLATIVEAFPDAKRVGVIAPTSVEGIGFWKAVLAAGKTPVMLQYPTPKLSRVYWQREIAHTAATLDIDAVAFFGPQANPGLQIPQLDLSETLEWRAHTPLRQLDDGLMTQLSSGTTGHRKGVSLSVADTFKHVTAYNEVLGLGPEDCIVSWLPLYHDMGFIAAFVMPLMLNVPLVLIDPITWVRRPEVLFDLIERHRGTHCYMPNFGFELMARQGAKHGRNLSSMKRWISCSEPTRADSMKRFIDATGTEPSKISNCYAMAENIFAVTLSEGLETRSFDGAESVSCGRAIPGVELKLGDGEIWVRSAYSLKQYEGGEPIFDAEGYYPTGDLGEIVDGQLFVLGRKRDVMIHAGRKIILSDIDHEVGRLIPGSAGRIATVPVFNTQLGTDDPVCLVEDERYWAKNRDTRALNAIRAEAGLDQGRIEFVPPGFITKTSSGKINRRLTGQHWAEAATWRRGGRKVRKRSRAEFVADLADLFPGIDPGLPFDQQLDSLGLVNVSILLSEYGFEGVTGQAAKDLRFSARAAKAEATGPVLKVVSLFDGDYLLNLMPSVFAELGRELGVSIHYEHVCCPPAPILLSDLIFEEQFAGRDPREGVYDSLSGALRSIRNADLIIVDDLVQMGWPAINDTHYPRISRRFEADPRSDALAVRWARYSEGNDMIATELVASEEITATQASQGLDDLESYLGVPIVRVALTAQFGDQTQGWPVRQLRDCVALLARAGDPDVDFADLRRQLLAALLSACAKLKPNEGEAGHKWHVSDQNHWCSWLINRDFVDFVLDRHDSFLVLGKKASVPYLSNEAARRGKILTYRSDLICPPGDYACVLQTGSWGLPVTEKPIFPLMMAGWGNTPRNVPPSVAADCPANTERPLLSAWISGI